MADIQLTADGSQAIQTLKNIQNSVDKLSGGFKSFATDATKSLDGVKKNTDLLSLSVGGLTKALGLIGAAHALENLMEMGRVIRNVSGATDVSAQSVSAWGQAVKQSGGDGAKAAEDIIDFQSALADARNGSDEVAKSLGKLGITYNQLYQQNTPELFQRTVTALAGMPDKAERSRIAVQLLGRQFKDIDIGKVAQDFNKFNTGEFAGRSAEAAESAKKLAEIQSTFKKLGSIITEEFLIAFSGAIENVNKLSKALLEDRESIIKFVEVFKTILDWAVTIGSFFVGGWITKGVLKATTAVGEMAVSVGKFGESLGSTTKVAEIMGNSVTLIQKKAGLLPEFFYSAGRAVQSFGGQLMNVMNPTRLAGVLGESHPMVTALVDKLKLVKIGVGVAVGSLLNFWDNLIRIVTGSEAAGKELSAFEQVLHSLLLPVKWLIDGLGWLKDALLNLMPAGVADFFKSIGGYISDAASSLGSFFSHAEGASVALERQKKEQEAAAEAAKKQAQEAEALRQREAQRLALVAKLRTEIDSTVDAYKLSNKEQIDGIKNQMETIGLTDRQRDIATAIFELDKKRAQQIQTLNQKMEEWKNGTEEQKANLGIIKDAMAKVTEETEKQKAAVTELLNQQEKLTIANNARLFGIQQATDTMTKMADLTKQISQIGMSDLEKQVDDIKYGFKEAARQAIRLEEVRIGRTLNPEEQKAYFDAAKKGMDEVIEKTQELQQKSKEFGPAWDEAFKNYADSALNAANMARSAFSAVTGALDTLINNFVTNGTLDFKQFGQSIIQELIKIELKAQAMELWKMFRGGGAGGGGSSLLSGLSSLFGGFFADGGQPPMNKASIVGENGPELFVPRSAGTIVPNGAMGGGGQQVVNHNVTNITNNVSALDAQSVSQLFAQNRRELFGVVEMARKEMPGR